MEILQDVTFAIIIVLSIFGITFYLVECVINYKKDNYTFLWERLAARIVYAVALFGLLVISTLMFGTKIKPAEKFQPVTEKLYRRI